MDFEPYLYQDADRPPQHAVARQQFNPNEFIAQTLAPVSQLKAVLPAGYIAESVSGPTPPVCPVCGQFPNNMVQCACGCLVCADCHSPDSFCDRHQVYFGEALPMSAETESTLRETFIKCPFEAAGCDQVISAFDFADHI